MTTATRCPTSELSSGGSPQMRCSCDTSRVMAFTISENVMSGTSSTAATSPASTSAAPSGT